MRSHHCLGVMEGMLGNSERAVKHYLIGAEAGLDGSLKAIRNFFMASPDCKYYGKVKKDAFEKALRSHQKSQDKMRSDQREAFKVYQADKSDGGVK